MRLSLPIIILLVFCWGFDARAQTPEELPSMPGQWQLTLDTIKSKVQTLVIENNGLQMEYRQLVGRAQKLQQLINDQQYKNEQISRFLDSPRARADQQARIEELTQIIKTKSQQAMAYEEQLEDLTRKQESRSSRPAVDDQTAQLHKQLEDESTQEVLLANELGALKTADKTQNLDSATPLSKTDARTYDKLKRRKEQLEADIYAYESRMEELRQSSVTALSWPLKKKEMVHEMVQIDARNNQMRDMIKVLQEDIDVLRDQVARLERRVNFVQDKGTKQ